VLDYESNDSVVAEPTPVGKATWTVLHTGSDESDEHPYTVAFRTGDPVTVSGRPGVSDPGILVPGCCEADRAQALADPDPALPYGGCVKSETLARPRTVSGDADAA
jgi:hypothetical protein